MSPWSPARSLESTEAILCGPGRIHEVETILLDGRPQRVYKNLWPTLRSFWLSSVERHAAKTYIVFENERYTFQQVHQRIIKVAAVLRNLYGIRKGDRVAICSQNCPDYLVVFWASQLLGAVPALINAWLPLEPLQYCISHTECKLVILDQDRADRVSSVAADILRNTATNNILVFEDGAASQRPNMISFNSVVNSFVQVNSILAVDPQIQPEDNAAIMFTSGTTGLPKGVLSTQRQFLTNVPNIMAGGIRASLRRGEDYPDPYKEDGPQKGMLIAVPLFHVTGTTSFAMMATATGMKIVLAPKWVTEDAVRLIKQENIRVAGGVPTMIIDLIESSLARSSLDALIFGGSPAPDTLVPRAQKTFPSALLSQAYGLTETNSIAVSFAGEDYTARPGSTGRASPVNEIQIVRDGTVMPPGQVGEVRLRGPNVMKCYWGDLEATANVITNDGWLKTGDLGFLDEEGFLYIKDRLKDIIIRGGENIDSVSIENALYRDPRVQEAAAVGVPDERLGELVAAVVSVKPAFQGEVTEASLIALARKYLPRFAVPVMIVISERELEHTPSGKIVKGHIRQIARARWTEIRQHGPFREPHANL